MKNILWVTKKVGLLFIISGVIFLLIHSMVVTGSKSESFARDLFGFPIPHAPEWTSYFPILGMFLTFVFELFSLHGLVGIVIFGILVYIGIRLMNIDDAKNKAGKDTQSKLFPNNSSNHLDDVARRVADIVLTANRSMPAHYTSNGDRAKSFCVDFDIESDDEYNMASFAFYKGSEAISMNKVDAKPTDLEASAIIKLGEDITVGSYILKKLGDTSHLPELIEELTKENVGIEKVSQMILDDKVIQDYFAACRSYGLSKASTLQQPEVS